MIHSEFKSYVGTVTAKTGRLIGGVKTRISSRFESVSHAFEWVKICVEANEYIGLDPDIGLVSGSKLKHEISSEDWIGTEDWTVDE